MTRRVLLLGVAFAVALVGVGVLYLYVRGADQRALAGVEAREVWVAREGVAPGTPVSDLLTGALVELSPVPGTAVLPGALGPEDDLAGEELAGRVTRQQLLPGEQLVPEKLGPPGDTADALAEPATGDAGGDAAGDGEPGAPGRPGTGEHLLLGSFQFADPERVAGFLRPDSRVAVFYTYATPGVGPESPQDTVTTVLLPGVEVAAVGGVTARDQLAPGDGQQPAADVPQALVTLRVSAGQMAQLVTAQRTGTLYLALLPTGTEVGDVSVRASELTAGTVPGQVAPAPDGG